MSFVSSKNCNYSVFTVSENFLSLYTLKSEEVDLVLYT